MTFHDDWFAEPAKPGPTRKHEAYTRRLIAWGWLETDGTPSWEVSSFYKALKDLYLPAIREQLAQPLMLMRYGDAWILNPEAPPE